MAIKHTAVSYYGFNYVEHAEKDFIEMKEHGCDTVILAITEFDMDFWFPNINNIVKTAHKVGLRVIADTWGIGKYFGGAFFCYVRTPATRDPLPQSPPQARGRIRLRQ